MGTKIVSLGTKQMSLFILIFNFGDIGTKWGHKDISLRRKKKCPFVPTGQKNIGKCPTRFAR